MRKFYVDSALGQWHIVADAPAHDGAVPLVMLNSRGRSLLPLMPLLRPGFYGVQVDIPGMSGQSYIPQPGVTMTEIGEGLVDILDALGIAKAHFFAFHTGHKIVCSFGAHHPDRIARLIIAGKTHSIVPDLASRNDVMQRYIARRPPDTVLVSMEGKYVDQGETAIGNEAIYQANFCFDLAAALPLITAPTLVFEVVSANEDRDPGRQGDALASLMPDARALAVPQVEPAGLQLYVGVERTVEIILDFMRG